MYCVSLLRHAVCSKLMPNFTGMRAARCIVQGVPKGKLDVASQSALSPPREQMPGLHGTPPGRTSVESSWVLGVRLDSYDSLPAPLLLWTW